MFNGGPWVSGLHDRLALGVSSRGTVVAPYPPIVKRPASRVNVTVLAYHAPQFAVFARVHVAYRRSTQCTGLSLHSFVQWSQTGVAN